MASLKRDFDPQELESEGEQPASKNTRSDTPVAGGKRVVLNPADCNLDFDIANDYVSGSALHEEGFAYCWSGARANVGITSGKYCFGCKIISAQPVTMEDTPPDQQHVCRIGISRGDDAVGNLGETMYSFGFGGTGKFSTAGKFSDYGEKFGVGDVILCALDLESKPLASIGFSKNGKWLGVAKEFDAGPRGIGVVDSPRKELQWESAIFPHVLLKNVKVQLQFSAEDGLVPAEGYKPWSSTICDGNAIMGPIFSDAKDCEVMMMVGLPASGKTTWAENWVKEHPEKRYVFLGTNLVLDQMKVPGLLRKNNYSERFECLMSLATPIFDILLARAAKTPRNYIIDQTNVFKSARKRKLRPFTNFHKIAVVSFPSPEELKFRLDKRFSEMGKEVPAEAVNNMLANFVLPTSKDVRGSDEFFDQVIFTELGEEDSQRYLEKMKLDMRTNSTSTPYSRETFVASFVRSSDQTPTNYWYQNMNQMGTITQGLVFSPGAYQMYQSPHILGPSVPYDSYESNIPTHNSKYFGGYGATPGGGPDNYHPNYVAFDPYRSNISSAVNVLPLSFRYDTSVTVPQASLLAPTVPTYGPNNANSQPPYGPNYGRPQYIPPPSSYIHRSQPEYGNYPPRYN